MATGLGAACLMLWCSEGYKFHPCCNNGGCLAEQRKDVIGSVGKGEGTKEIISLVQETFRGVQLKTIKNAPDAEIFQPALYSGWSGPLDTAELVTNKGK